MSGIWGEGEISRAKENCKERVGYISEIYQHLRHYMIKECPNEAEKEWTEEDEKNQVCGGLRALLVTNSICKQQNPTLVDVRKPNKTEELTEKPLDNSGNYWKNPEK